MANIYIIDNLRLNKSGLQIKDENGDWIDLHCQQGRLDGACAVYSTIMALLCMGVLSEADIQIMTKPDRRTKKGKFLYHLPQFGITECLIQYKCSVHTPPSHAIRSG